MQDANKEYINLSDHSMEDLEKNLGTESLPWNATNKQGENLLQQALINKDEKKIECLLKSIGKLKSKDLDLYKKVINYQIPYEKKYSPYNVMQPKGMTVLMYAIAHSPEMVERFLELSNLELNLTNGNGHNAAVFACANPFVDLETIKAVIKIYDERELSYVERDARDLTMLMNAAFTGDKKRIEYLLNLEKFYLFRHCSFQTILHCAAEGGNVETFSFILEKMKEKMKEENSDADVEEEIKKCIYQPTYAGMTILESAARLSNDRRDTNNGYEMVLYLLDNYFNSENNKMLHSRTACGQNVLHTLCFLYTFCIDDTLAKYKRDLFKKLCDLGFKPNDFAIGVSSQPRRTQISKSRLNQLSNPPLSVKFDELIDFEVKDNLQEVCADMRSKLIEVLDSQHTPNEKIIDFDKKLAFYRQFKADENLMETQTLCYSLKSHLAKAIEFGDTVMIDLLLEQNVPFDITALKELILLEKSQYASWPGYEGGTTRYDATIDLLINKGLIKKGDDDKIVPFNVGDVVNNTLAALQGFSLENYHRSMDVFAEKYKQEPGETRENVGTYFTKANESSLWREIKKNNAQICWQH